MRSDVATLLEALPYIREFHGKTIVIKYGGAAMIDRQLREEFARDVVLLKYVGMNPVIVHGGGRRSRELHGASSDMPVEFVDGLRVTDQDTVEVAKMVLSARSTRTSSCASTATASPRSGSPATTARLFRVRRKPAPGRQGHRLRRQGRPRQHRRARPHRATTTSR